MNASMRKQPHWRTATSADLALVGIYLWFVCINLGAVWRGDLAVLVLLLQECCVIILALWRRRAKSAAHWESPEALLGWCGTLGPLFVRPADCAPMPILWLGAVAQGIGNVLAVAGICDLGRSFGIIAANRGIQTGGLYRYVRHPIYAAYLLAFGGFVLAHPSWHNALVLLMWGVIQMARIQAEERLLSADPRYAAYTARVRYRLILCIW